MDKSSTILSTHQLAIGYGTANSPTTLANNINLEIQKNELISLIGPNGVGKTTFLKTISGLHSPLSGEIYLEDANLRTYKPKKLAQKISLVLTDKIRIGNLTVYELVKMGRYPHTSWLGHFSKTDYIKVDNAIEICGIGYFKNSKIDEISDGQLQKAIIARALAQDGNLLIFDEPTAHLDANNRYAVFHLLQKLTEEYDKTILISTHQIEMANSVSSRLWCMQCGENIISTKTGSLKENQVLSKMFPYLKQLMD